MILPSKNIFFQLHIKCSKIILFFYATYCSKNEQTSLYYWSRTCRQQQSFLSHQPQRFGYHDADAGIESQTYPIRNFPHRIMELLIVEGNCPTRVTQNEQVLPKWGNNVYSVLGQNSVFSSGKIAWVWTNNDKSKKEVIVKKYFIIFILIFY